MSYIYRKTPAMDLSEQEQIAMLSMNEATDKHNNQTGYVTAKTDRIRSGDGVVTGTFTGTSIQTTMPQRTGRGLMSPGIRIMDVDQIIEHRRLKEQWELKQLKEKQNGKIFATDYQNEGPEIGSR